MSNFIKSLISLSLTGFVLGGSAALGVNIANKMYRKMEAKRIGIEINEVLDEMER